MIKRETIIVLMGVAFGVGAISLLSFFIIWIGFPADNPQESFKDALGFTVGLFGGLATFGAAVIAAHLFNDWRVVKQYEIILDYILIIKNQTKELISFINSNRGNFIKCRLKIKNPDLTMQDFKILQNEIYEIEGEIVLRLNLIHLEMNELYFLKTKNPQDPVGDELIKKINYLNKIGVTKDNYVDVWNERSTTEVFDEYFHYITDDLTSFVYDKIMTRYLDDLILDAN